MTTSTSSTDAAQSQLALLRSRWSSLSARAALSASAQAIESVARSVDGLEQRLKDLRVKGFAFGKGWEAQAAALKSEWPAKKQESLALLDKQSANLRSLGRALDFVVERAGRDLKTLPDAEQKVSSFENELAAAEKRIEAVYSGLRERVTPLDRAMHQAEFLLKELDGATFKLQAGENAVAACKAEWEIDKEKYEGILYLTDRRLLYEQEQEVATAKVLFIATKKELVQKVLWESPVGALENAKAEDKGGFIGIGQKQTLTLTFSSLPHDLPLTLTLNLKDGASNEEWDTLIERVKSGQVEAERVEAPADAAPAVGTAPTICPSCGGRLPEAFKGMTHLECPYCGQRVPIP
jgi:hypothetical protein